MPNYTNSAQAALLRENSQVFFWDNEAVAASSLSIAFQLARVNRTFYPWGISFEVIFSGNPGAFEVDIMAANNDEAANFVQIGNITVTNNATSGAYVGRWDMPINMWPRYIAGYLKTLTNSGVKTTLQVTR
jgi:hypothetical protein